MRIKNISKTKKQVIHDIYGNPYPVKPGEEITIFNVSRLPNSFEIIALTEDEKLDIELRLRIISKGNFYKRQLEVLVGKEIKLEDAKINIKEINNEVVINTEDEKHESVKAKTKRRSNKNRKSKEKK